MPDGLLDESFIWQEIAEGVLCTNGLDWFT